MLCLSNSLQHTMVILHLFLTHLTLPFSPNSATLMSLTHPIFPPYLLSVYTPSHTLTLSHTHSHTQPFFFFSFYIYFYLFLYIIFFNHSYYALISH
ncbi:hypothetical protein F4703DRAFT_1844800 [Phycomyces blakesleeanus]